MIKLGAHFLSRYVVNQQKYLVTTSVARVNRYSTSADEIFAKQLKFVYIFHQKSRRKSLKNFLFRKLQDEKISEAENGLEFIFAHVLQKKKLKEVRGDELKKFKLSDEQIKMIESMCDCRISRMPVQYILKEWEFRDLLLKMQIPVFIPRKLIVFKTCFNN